MARFWQTALVLKSENSGFGNLELLLQNEQEGLRPSLGKNRKMTPEVETLLFKGLETIMHKGHPGISIRLAWMCRVKFGLNTERLFR